jgi:hypothetical protein
MRRDYRVTSQNPGRMNYSLIRLREIEGHMNKIHVLAFVAAAALAGCGGIPMTPEE